MKINPSLENMLKALNNTLLVFNLGLNPFTLLKNLVLIHLPLPNNFLLLCMVLNMLDKMIEMTP